MNLLYTVIIYPIQLVLECCYTLFSQILSGIHGVEGLSVIALSFVVTLFTIPLYMIAEKWAETERLMQEKMTPRLARIKSAFKGDERYMMQSAYYRQNHYHPIMALRSSFSILIQVPFFVAAYSFLSHLESLEGVSFFFIKNFGEPDKTFFIGSFAINILPIAMTLINCVSGFVYSKGHPLREKIQIYGCAALFLVILYDSPSGLVVYWTMNNILSLVKNIFYKLKNPKKVLYILCCVIAVLFIFSAFTLLRHTKTLYKLAIILFACFLIMIPQLIKLYKKIIFEHIKILEEDKKLCFSLFIFSAIGITLLAGLVIPSILIQSEPEQFSYLDGYKSPFVFLRTPFFQAIGLFLFWPCCFYALFSTQVKKSMAIIFNFLFLLFIVNCFAFSGNYGPIEPTLLFMEEQYFTTPMFTCLNIVAIIVLLSVFICILHFNPRILSFVSIIFIVSFASISIRNVFSINNSFKNMNVPITMEKPKPIYSLSRNGKNVIVIMQDRLISPYIPEVLEERPDLKQRLDGFIYYPNCITMGGLTMFGVPGVFGGYDYTPYYINHATEKTLQQKHNEAILTMPLIFTIAGWDATISDMPYENYYEQPAIKMYENYPEIKHLSVHGSVSDIWYSRNNFKRVTYISDSALRNFLLFSIFKMASPFLRRVIYHDEYWTTNDKSFQESAFFDNYAQLDLLPELFDDTNEKNSFIMIDNEVTHRPTILQPPDYKPQNNSSIDSTVAHTEKTSKHTNNAQYHVIISALLRWADFFDYLKKENLYDNTRIIIVSDHGAGGRNELYKETGKLPFDIQKMSAALIVKDFDSNGELKTDMTFMTNADTPYIATKDLIEDAKNPFTGTPIKVDNKFERSFIMLADAVSTKVRHQTSFDYSAYYKIKDNIFDENNWYIYNERETE